MSGSMIFDSAWTLIGFMELNGTARFGDLRDIR